MFKNLIFTFFLLFSSFITIYPSKKENNKLFDYCYSLEKIISKNSVQKNKNLSKSYKTFAKEITKFGTDRTKGALVNKMIDQYKISKKLFIITVVPNQFFCLVGYWTEKIYPGIFQSIFYEKSKQRINQYKDIKKDVDEFMKDINFEYKSIKKEIKSLF